MRTRSRNPTFDEDYVPTREELIRMQTDPYGIDRRLRADKRAFLQLDRLWQQLMVPVADQIVADLQRARDAASDAGERRAAADQLFDVQRYLERGGEKESRTFWGLVPRAAKVKYGTIGQSLIEAARGDSLADSMYDQYMSIEYLHGDVPKVPPPAEQAMKEISGARASIWDRPGELFPDVAPSRRGQTLGGLSTFAASSLTETVWRARNMLPAEFTLALDEAINSFEQREKMRSRKARSWLSRFATAIGRALPTRLLIAPNKISVSRWGVLLEVEESRDTKACIVGAAIPVGGWSFLEELSDATGTKSYSRAFDGQLKRADVWFRSTSGPEAGAWDEVYPRSSNGPLMAKETISLLKELTGTPTLAPGVSR
jgi:hypothetical protein